MKRILSLTLAVLLAAGFAPVLERPVAEASAAMAGSGTAGDPFLVATANNLAAIGTTGFPSTAHYRQTANISLDAGFWVPINIFSGVFDGGGYTISNLSTAPTGAPHNGGGSGGLFRTVNPSAVVKNLKLSNVNILGGVGIAVPGVSGNMTGGIAARNDGTIRNSSVTGTIGNAGNAMHIGGIAGANLGTIENCHAAVTAEGAGNVGGLVGQNTQNGTIRNSVALNPLVSTTHGSCGRIAGANAGTLANNAALDTMQALLVPGGQKIFTKGHDTIDGDDITAARGAARIAGIGKEAGWSILWLIIPELNARGIRHSSAAHVPAMQQAAKDFKNDVQNEIMNINGLDLNLDVTAVVSSLAVTRFTTGADGGHAIMQDDIDEILNLYAPNRERDYDSLIVMAEFRNLHTYGGLNYGWMSFCPLPYSAGFPKGYDVQLHEWLHQMENIPRIPEGQTVPTADDLQKGNYIYDFLAAKYPLMPTGHQGGDIWWLSNEILQKYYFYNLAGALPAGTLRGKPATAGFPVEYWAARPTLGTPTIEFTFNGPDGKPVTRSARGITTVGPDAKIAVTYSYDVELFGGSEFFLDIPDVGFRTAGVSDIVFDGERKFTIDLAKINGAPLIIGQRYNLRSHGNIRAKTALFNPAFGEIPFIVAEGGVEPVEGREGVVIEAANNPEAFINLTTERVGLPEGYTVQAFSLDGGQRWRRGALPAQDRFPRLLNRGMTLHVTNRWDTSEKKPSDEGQTITFPEIKARPKRNPGRLAPFYGSTHWGLAPRRSAAWSDVTSAGIEYAPSSNGRTPNDNTWLPLPAEGIEIASGGRNTFLFRIAPDGSGAVPASPVWRVRPANFGKTPGYKAPTAARPLLRLKRGDLLLIDGQTTPLGSLTERTDLTVVHGTPGAGELPSAAVVTIWRAATGRRPPSLVQTLTLPVITPPETAG